MTDPRHLHILVIDRLAELGIETKGWGSPLTDLLNERAPLIAI